MAKDFPTSSWEDHFFFPGIHYVAIPRSMDEEVIEKVLNAVFDDTHMDLFTNMTRLANTVADRVANDDDWPACFASRAVELWQSLLEAGTTNSSSNDNAQIDPLIDWNEFSGLSHQEMLQKLLGVHKRKRKWLPKRVKRRQDDKPLQKHSSSVALQIHNRY
jgi:hypothetical protein